MSEFKECEYLPKGFTVNLLGDIKSPAGKLLKKQISNSGYYYYSLWFMGRSYAKFLHRAVAFAFIPKVDDKSFVNHIDGNKINNSIENLEWCTIKENNDHSRKMHGHMPPLNFKGKFGFDHNRSKSVVCVETGEVFGSQLEAQRKLKMGNGCVSWSIKNKKPIFGMHFELK
jgi:hypothetical protein